MIASYLSVLGFEEARRTATPAADVLLRTIGPKGAKALSLLVMVSALGAINGMILTGSRIYATIGEDHRVFAWLGRWSGSRSPVAAIIVQAVLALFLVIGVGTQRGQESIDRLLGWFGLSGLPWDSYFGGFETLVAGTGPVFWMFFLLTGLSVFILRIHNPHRIRPFTIPWFPLPPIIFLMMCIYMLYSSMTYAGWLALLGFVPLVTGFPLYLISRR